jgi:hypothetical protein
MDRERMFAEVVSSTHVEADDTVVLLRVGASRDEPGWQVQLADIRSVATVDGRSLYERASARVARQAEPDAATDRPSR